MRLTIDFEVRSPVDIKKAGPWKYAEHPNTLPLCLAYKSEREKAIWVNPEIWNPIFAPKLAPIFCSPDDSHFKHWVSSARIVEAHNAEFERAIWRKIMVPRFGWPDILDHKWRCSAAKAAAHALPRSLEGAGAALKLDIKKDMDGHRIMMKMCRPRKPRKDEDPNGLYWNEDPEDFLKLFRYCLQDVEAEHAISQALPDLSPMEQKVWMLDQKMNERGILADVSSAKKIIYALKEYETTLLEEVSELTNGSINSVKQVAAMAEFCGTESMTKACVAEALEKDQLPQVKRLLEIRQTLGKSSVSKFKAILERACTDNRLRANLMYHGATTGRWTAKGVQLQNLPRKSVDEVYFDLALQLLHELDTLWIENLFGFRDPVELAQALIRPMLTTDEDRDLLCADFAQIEARVLLWFAEELEALGLFRSGKDIYCDMAGTIYEREVTKKDKNERQVGKTAILGLGFGMGGKKFKMTCATQAGVEIGKKLARKVVKAYRKKYPGAPAFWYSTERSAIEAVQTGGPVENGKTTWLMNGRFLQVILPSGRRLSYPYPALVIEPAYIFPALDDEGKNATVMIVGGTKAQAVKKAKVRADDEDLKLTGEAPIEREKAVLTHWGVDTKTKRWMRDTTYGGKLVENIVQATARDLMALAMLRLEDSGYPLLLSVHDEVISEAPKDFGSLEDFERITAIVPDWAASCPVAAEGYRAKRYKK